MGYNRQYQAVAAPIVKEKMKNVDEASATKKRFEGEVQTQQDSIKKHTDAVRSIILGQDERLNWIQFNQFVNRAFPKPDGSNLNREATKPDNKSAQALYFDYLGKEAWQKFHCGKETQQSS